MRARPVRIQARKVRSTARKSRGVALESSSIAKVLNTISAKPQNQYSTDDKKERGGGEGNLYVEDAPEEADEEAGDEVADGVDGGEGSEGHAVLFLGDEFGGEGIFQWLFGADVKTREDKNQSEQPRRGCSDTKKNRCDAGEGITRSEHSIAMRNMVAEPATHVGGAGVEDVMQSVEADGEAGGTGEAMSRREHARGVENQQGMGKIAGAENADAHEQTPE